MVDVFVSHKRRYSRENCFGFVQFRKMEETLNAIRNLNGIKVREKILKVSSLNMAEMVCSSLDKFFMKELKVQKIWGVRREPKKVVMLPGVIKRW